MSEHQWHKVLEPGPLGEGSIEKGWLRCPWHGYDYPPLTGLHNPDFAAFATLCGAQDIRVTDLADLDAAIAEALAHPGPALVDIVTDALLV